MGRPLKPIDAEQVYKLARLGCTQDEIGDYFGCVRSVISDRFRPEFELGRAASKMSLRRWQMKRAQAGSDAMLIHLGKHHLGQGTGLSNDIGDVLDEIISRGQVADDPGEVSG